MEKSERLKAAAIAPDNLRAAVAGLRLPRPAAPSTDKERAELERKSAAQRGEEAGRKVQQLLGEQNERKEVTDTFVRQHAGSLRRLLKAGGVTLTLTLTPTLTLSLTPTLTPTLTCSPPVRARTWCQRTWCSIGPARARRRPRRDL